MIVTKTVTVDGREFKKTYSDAGWMLACGLERYEYAYDLPESEREYEETSRSIPGFEIDADVALAEIAEVMS